MMYRRGTNNTSSHRPTCRNFSTYHDDNMSNNMVADEPQRLFLWVPTSNIVSSSSISEPNNDSFLQQLHQHQHIIRTTLQQNILLPSSALQQLVHWQPPNNEGEDDSHTTTTTTTNNNNRRNRMTIVQSVEDIVAAVNQHYNTDCIDTTTDENHHHTPPQQRQFVGGMGEQDLGVYFISLPSIESSTALSAASSSSILCEYHDLLNHTATLELLKDGIGHVKAIRHGVPFGIYTSGIVPHGSSKSFPPLPELDIDIYEVSLFGGGNGSPQQYHHYLTHTIGRSHAQPDDFLRICSFVTTAVEELAQNVEVSLLASSSSSTSETNESRQLALSLGARQVHLYTNEGMQ